MIDLNIKLSNLQGFINNLHVKIDKGDISLAMEQMYIAQLKDLYMLAEETQKAIEIENAKEAINDPARMVELVDVVEGTLEYLGLHQSPSGDKTKALNVMKINVVKSLSLHHYSGVMSFIQSTNPQLVKDTIIKMNEENFNVQAPSPEDLIRFRNEYSELLSH